MSTIKRNYAFSLHFNKVPVQNKELNIINVNSTGRLSFNKPSIFNDNMGEQNNTCSFLGSGSYLSIPNTFNISKVNFCTGLWYRFPINTIRSLVEDYDNGRRDIFIPGIKFNLGNSHFIELKLAGVIKSGCFGIVLSLDGNTLEDYTVVLDTKWHHVFAGYSSDDNNLSIYYDFHNSQTAKFNIPSSSTIGNITIGEYQSSNNGSYEVEIDDPFLYLAGYSYNDVIDKLNILKKPVDRRFIESFPNYEDSWYDSSLHFPHTKDDILASGSHFYTNYRSSMDEIDDSIEITRPVYYKKPLEYKTLMRDRYKFDIGEDKK